MDAFIDWFLNALSATGPWVVAILQFVQAAFWIVMIVATIGVKVDARRNRAHMKEHGWYVYHGGGAEESTIDYFEGDQHLFFIGPRSGEYVEVPTAAAWDGLVKDFARGRRDLILGRIRERFPKLEFREVTKYTR